MRLRHVAFGLFVVVPLVACRDKPKGTTHVDTNPISQALGEAASAQALASAMKSQTASLESTTGSIHAVGGELGTWDVTLGECQSGEYNGFYGADFYVGETLRLRYVHDEAAGDIVKVGIPSKKDTVLVIDREAKCKVLEGNVEKTNYKQWSPKGDIRHINGHVKFDCEQPGSSGRVSGEVKFEHCH